MMPKHRQSYGRQRTTRRAERRSPAVLESSSIAAAREVARHFVVARWPQLAGVEPTVSTREMPPISRDLLARVGLDNGNTMLRTANGTEYTFTFAGEASTRDGMVAPLIAAVTVNAQRRIVRTSVSK